MEQIEQARQKLLAEYDQLEDKAKILRSYVFKELYGIIPTLEPQKRGDFGKKVNELKNEFESKLAELEDTQTTKPPIDVTAPFDVNIKPQDQPQILQASAGSIHPLMSELDTLIGVFERMGFEAEESRQIDDDYHMFESLNFPEGHPARDDYDTFMTKEGLIAPAHTSTMQNRVIKARKERIESGETIQVIIPGRVFRNEDLDARHEHTFYQLEGVVVGEGINTGHLMATVKTFLEAYYEKDLEFRTQPFYFPFTEPSIEFAISCPFCNKSGCKVCSQTGWIELGGSGMIHPNVLKMADIDPEKYSGFAWGFGIDRLVMMKHDIEDVRHFHSAKLDFLRQFKG